MQSQLIFLIALAAGCTSGTLAEYHNSGQGIPNFWKMTITNTLDVDFDEILNGTVVFLNGKNLVQLKDGRFIPVDLSPFGMDEVVNTDVNVDFNARLYIPLRIGRNIVKVSPTTRSVEFYPNQEFVYMSILGDKKTFPCWEIDYDHSAATVYISENAYSTVFTIREKPGCL